MLCSKFTKVVYLGERGEEKRNAQLRGKKLFDLGERGYEHVFVGQFPFRDEEIEDGPGNGRIFHPDKDGRVTSFQPALEITCNWHQKDQLLL